MPRSPLTDKFDEVQRAVDYVNALSEDVRLALMDRLWPEPEPAKKPQKKSSKKTGGKGGGVRCTYVYGSGVPCNRMAATTVHVNEQHVDYHEFQPPKSSKSARASGLGAAIDHNLSQRRREAMEDITGESKEPCAKCSLRADANIHHLQTQDDYHEFQPPAAHAASGGEVG